MRAEINTSGILCISPENTTELYALNLFIIANKQTFSKQVPGALIASTIDVLPDTAFRIDTFLVRQYEKCK